jgi:predicted transcriptional regulator
MKARDIMTRDVIMVSPHTSVRDIAAIMVEKHISGLPVLTHDGKIIGMVSESDLLHRAELGTEHDEHKRKWWLDFNALAREYAKAHGLKAQVVMSRYVVAVHDDAELRDVADILDRHRIKRVPVVLLGCKGDRRMPRPVRSQSPVPELRAKDSSRILSAVPPSPSFC